MGKINKFANIYDKDGNLLRHVDEDGKLKNYTIEELEDLIDKLAEDKDENGNVKDPQALNNVNMILFQQYQKYGNPHEAELIEKLKELQKQRNLGATMAGKTAEEVVIKALTDAESGASVEPTEGTISPKDYEWDVVPQNGHFYAGNPTKEMFKDAEVIMKTSSEDEEEDLHNDTKSLDKEESVERESNYEPEQYVQFEELHDSEEIKEAA